VYSSTQTSVTTTSGHGVLHCATSAAPGRWGRGAVRGVFRFAAEERTRRSRVSEPLSRARRPPSRAAARRGMVHGAARRPRLKKSAREVARRERRLADEGSQAGVTRSRRGRWRGTSWRRLDAGIACREAHAHAPRLLFASLVTVVAACGSRTGCSYRTTSTSRPTRRGTAHHPPHRRRQEDALDEAEALPPLM